MDDDITRYRGFDQMLRDAAEYRVLRRIYHAAREEPDDKLLELLRDRLAPKNKE